VKKNLDRIAGTVKALKVFAAPPTQDEGGVDLAAVLKRCEQVLAPLKNARTHTEYRVEARLPRVRGEASQLEQVLVNLMTNALQALPEGRPENLILVEARQAGAAVLLSVRDNGEGIAPEHLPRIFDPFFTTRGVGGGVGLGLSMCHEMITRGGGSLRAESTQGAGTTLIVTLPLAEAKAAAPAPLAPAEARPRLKVLVVDDEPDLRRTLVRILRKQHDVEVAENGAQVLERVARGERWDVVLCDLLMPNVTGIELYESLQASDPALAARMAFMTGGAASERSAEFLRTMTSPRLDKPFDPAELLALISRIGARPAPSA
jgi:CheY-like chemotaxis protein/two-component sensor histidine kinase